MLLPLSLLCEAKVGGLEWVTLDKILFHVYFVLFIFRAKIDIHNINIKQLATILAKAPKVHCRPQVQVLQDCNQ